MKTTILSEYGFHEALLGMGLSHGKTSGIISLWDIATMPASRNAP